MANENDDEHPIEIQEIDDDHRFFDSIDENLLTILPNNWENSSQPDEYEFAEITRSIQKVLAKEKVSAELYGFSTESKIQHHRSAEIVLPVLYFSAKYIIENSEAVNVVINIFSNYLSEVFFKKEDSTRVKFSIVEEQKKGNRLKIEYEGPVSGVKDFTALVKKFKK